MNISLTPSIEKALADEAQRQGTTPERLALKCLRERFLPEASREAPGQGETLADFLADFIGIISSREQAPLSEDCGRQFADGMEDKRRRGRL